MTDGTENGGLMPNNENHLEIGITPSLATSVISPKNIKPKFLPDRTDSLFAVFIFVLGYLFSRWVLGSWQGWGVAAFTTLYCASISYYYFRKGIKPVRSGLFWMSITWLTGLSFALWAGSEMGPWRVLLLFSAAFYWILCATGTQLFGKTTNWLPIDAINAVFIIPFRNFAGQYIGLGTLRGNRKVKGTLFLSIVLGAVLALMITLFILPMLLRADSGGFYRIMDSVFGFITNKLSGVIETIPYLIAAIPISAYMFGLIAGCAHKRGCDTFKTDAATKLSETVRIVPAATVYTLMGLVSCLYIVFIGSQIPYFFSAFTGRLPDGWLIYSEYARYGFFELCGIVMINLSVIAVSNVFIVKKDKEQVALKGLNVILSILTLLLIVTAFSKMALYIQAYGLSMKRLLPCVLMALLAVVCFAILLLQKRSFSIVRFAVTLGAVTLCLLCLIDPDGLVARYNADRYLAGTLSDFDTDILYRAEAAGVSPAIDVLLITKDVYLKGKINEYLNNQQTVLDEYKAGHLDSMQNALAREKISEQLITPLK